MSEPVIDGPATTGETDGRRARTERSRTAVIDAVFELVCDGHLPPQIDQIAARAGVSQASIYRYFGSIDELHGETVERFFARFGALFEIPEAGIGALDERIERYVSARIVLFETVGPIMRMGRVRALEHPRIAAGLRENRLRMRASTAVHFAPELADPDGSLRADVVDEICSIESWVTMTTLYDHDREQIRRVWVDVLTRILGR